MIRTGGFRRRDWAALTLGVVVTLLASRGVAGAAPIFAMADASAVVVRGTVEGVTPYPKARLTVFRIRVARVLKGDVAAGETIDLAQEMLFATTQPYFTAGTDTLVFAVPLPGYSSFREALPEGRYWRWTERLETAPDVARTGEAGLADAVAGYLAAANDAEALADFLVRAVVGSNARVRQDALAVIGAKRETGALLDASRLQPVAEWLRDDRVPVPERAAVLIHLARVGAVGVRDLAESLIVAAGPLQAPAVDALVTIGAPPPEERLIAWSSGTDEALRLAASRGLAKSGSPAAMTRIAALLESDASRAVRLAVVHALGRTQAPQVVGLLAAELPKSDKEVTLAAADALAKQGSDEALAVLEKAVEDGPDNARLGAAFALTRMDRRDAMEFLEHVEQTHPDPGVRRLCKLALGESMHEH